MRDRDEPKTREYDDPPDTPPKQRERKNQLESKKTEGDADNPLICRGVD
jgi:hypothetical protein